MGTVYSFPSYYSLVQPPKESETLRQAIAKIHNLADYERDTLYLRSSAAVVYSLFVSVISTLDAASYLVRIPVQFTKSIVAFEFKTGVLGIGYNVANSIHSFKLSILLVISAVSGIFLPYYAFKLLPDTNPVHQKAEERLAQLMRLIEAKQNELDETVNALASLSQVTKARYDQLEQERTTLEGRIHLLRSEHHHLVAACNRLQEGQPSSEDYANIASQVKAAEAHWSGLRIEIQVLEESKNHFESEIRTLQQDKDNAQQQLRVAQELLEETRQSIKSHQAEQERLDLTINTSQQDAARLSRENTASKQQLDTVLARLEEQKEKLVSALATQRRIEQETTTAQELLKRARASIGDLQTEQERLELTIKTLEQNSAQLTGENTAAEQQLETVLARLEEQKAQLEGILAEQKRLRETSGKENNPPRRQLQFTLPAARSSDPEEMEGLYQLLKQHRIDAEKLRETLNLVTPAQQSSISTVLSQLGEKITKLQGQKKSTRITAAQQRSLIDAVVPKPSAKSSPRSPSST